MIHDRIITDLEQLMEISLESMVLPYVKGNTIRIKNYVIRKNKNEEYIIFDCKTNEKIVSTFSKASALAIAKNLAQGNNITEKVIYYDNELKKHYNDACFYKHTMKVTKDETRKVIAETRLELALVRVGVARDFLDKFIFD
jgi:hypothetical protein